MIKHVHVHILRTVDGGMRVLDGDPYNRDENGMFATTSGGPAHHTKQAQSHRQHATSKGETHPDHADHIRAFSSHTRAAASLSKADQIDQTGKGREQIPHHMSEAEREAQGAKLHERNLKMESVQGQSNAPKGGMHWKEPKQAQVAPKRFAKGEAVRIHPDHLEKGEDPDEEYEVLGEGESERGHVEIRSKKNHGLSLGNPINAVHSKSLQRYKK